MLHIHYVNWWLPLSLSSIKFRLEQKLLVNDLEILFQLNLNIYMIPEDENWRATNDDTTMKSTKIMKTQSD